MIKDTARNKLKRVEAKISNFSFKIWELSNLMMRNGENNKAKSLLLKNYLWKKFINCHPILGRPPITEGETKECTQLNFKNIKSLLINSRKEATHLLHKCLNTNQNHQDIDHNLSKSKRKSLLS